MLNASVYPVRYIPLLTTHLWPGCRRDETVFLGFQCPYFLLHPVYLSLHVHQPSCCHQQPIQDLHIGSSRHYELLSAYSELIEQFGYAYSGAGLRER